MNELIAEHTFARETTKELVEAKDEDNLDEVLEKMHALTELYPKHIEKEDKIFFPECEEYFTDEQLQQILEQFWQFDQNMIHEKYKLVIENLK